MVGAVLGKVVGNHHILAGHLHILAVGVVDCHILVGVALDCHILVGVVLDHIAVEQVVGHRQGS